MLTLTVLVYSNAISQSNLKQAPLPLVVYNDNVNAPLTNDELAKIKEVYGEQADELILSRPQRLKDVKNILRNRVVFQELKAGETLKDCPLLSTVPLLDYYIPNISRDVNFDKNIFNPLKYNFNFHSRAAYMYKVDNANYYIMIKSQHQKN
ncbi:MAG: hypothetical protein ACSHXF_15420 [Aquaticitalea sp.]